jgi:hypothetical protein
MAARTPRVNPESTWRLYSALADVAGVSRPVRVDDPRVLVGRVRGRRGERAIVVNCSSDTVAAEPILAEGVELRRPAGSLMLEPFGVAALHCDGSPVSPTRAEPAVMPAGATSEGRDAAD